MSELRGWTAVLHYEVGIAATSREKAQELLDAHIEALRAPYPAGALHITVQQGLFDDSGVITPEEAKEEAVAVELRVLPPQQSVLP